MGKVSKCYNPRGESWARDESRFGFQMLSKMGWKKGKGLGKAENGIAEPIKVHMKDDVKGVGYHKRDDYWMDNQNEFDQLLARLNSNCESKIVENSKSLEVTSKSSKCRVHYSKIVRGKDAQQYSKKDIEAIIGKRRSNEKEKHTEKNETQTANLFETSKCTVDDYFVKKMAERKLKLGSSDNVTCSSTNIHSSESPTSDVLETEDLCNRKKRKCKMEIIETDSNGKEKQKKHKRSKKGKR